MPKGQWADKQAGGVDMIDAVIEEVAATYGEDDDDVQSLRSLYEELQTAADQMQDILYDLDRS